MKGLKYQKVTYNKMYRKWPVYIVNALPKNHNDAPFSFYSELQFLHNSHYTSFGQGVKFIQSVLKLSPMNFWRNLHLFEYQKLNN